MQKLTISLCLALALSINANSITNNPADKGILATSRISANAIDSNEIVFYTQESNFSPVIVLQDTALILWTWDDNTTDSSATPTKNYGSNLLRKNRLKVTPWSAVRRINIGYDAGDGGREDIELVTDQKVTAVLNLHNVAPYLREWCSSYNQILSLNFNNFVNLEYIECYHSNQLKTVKLANMPKLRRACFEDNNLDTLNISECPVLEDLRGLGNNFTDIIFSNSTDEFWHICVPYNEKITNTHLFNDLSIFPNVAELFIWNANQEGDLKITSSSKTKRTSILCQNNKYISADLRGSLNVPYLWSRVNLSYNNLTSANLQGCVQLIEINLSYNKLSSSAIDLLLQQLDSFGTSNGTADLKFNQPPTTTGLLHKSNLEAKGWVVDVDPSIIDILWYLKNSVEIFPNPTKDVIIIRANNKPAKMLHLSVINSMGAVITNEFITSNNNKDITVNLEKYTKGIYFIKISSDENYRLFKIVLTN